VRVPGRRSGRGQEAKAALGRPPRRDRAWGGPRAGGSAGHGSRRASIAENLILKSHRQAPMSTRGVLRHDRIRRNARELINDSPSRRPGPDTRRGSFPAATCRKSSARELSSAPTVIVAPIHARPGRRRDRGRAQPPPRSRKAQASGPAHQRGPRRILLLADRIAVMYEGRIVGVVPADRGCAAAA